VQFFARLITPASYLPPQAGAERRMGLGYSKRIIEEIERIEALEPGRAIEEAGIDARIKEVRRGVYVLEEWEHREGWLAPSLFTSYFRCPRRMWIENREGRVYTAEELKWIARGLIAERLWYSEHRGFVPQVKLEDPEERIRGVIDALKIGDGQATIVELKTSHRVTLGHRLQAMAYSYMVSKALPGIEVKTYIVYRHGVKRVYYNGQLVKRYRRRVEAAIRHRIPPPPPPDTRYCQRCPWRHLCSRLPKTDWDTWLISIGDFPKGQRCRNCQYLSFCRAYRAATGRYACENEQQVLVK